MAHTFRIDTNVPCPQTFMHPEVLQGHLDQLWHYTDLKASGIDPASITDEPAPSYLIQHPTHGNITGLQLDRRNGHLMVGLSVQGEKPRFLFAMDFIACHLGMMCGLPLTLQKNGTGFAYLRFRVGLMSQELQDFDAGTPKGWNIYMLPLIADAQGGQTVQHYGPLGELSSRYEQRFDHHYLGRDALRLQSVEATREVGKKARTPRLGREAFIAAALCYFDRNAARARLPITRDEYAAALHTAFSLADWRYGPVGSATPANRNEPLGAAA